MLTNHTRTARLVLALGALIASTATLANAAPTAWTTPSGDQSTFTYTGGQTLNNNFGSGTSTGSGFFFSPAGLNALAAGNFESIAPGSSSASDTLSVILNAKPATQFGSISTTFLGDYVTDGFASTSATGQLRVFNLDNLSAAPQVMNVSFGNTFGGDPLALNTPIGMTGGEFKGTAALALPAGWANIRVELDGMVQADALYGSSTIYAKDVSLDVATSPLTDTTTEVPLPAAVFAAPLLAGIALKARRKLIKR